MIVGYEGWQQLMEKLTTKQGSSRQTLFCVLFVGWNEYMKTITMELFTANDT